MHTTAGATLGYRPSPRPSFAAPTLVRETDAVRHTWGDEDAGLVDDLIYVSSQQLHTIVFALPPGGVFRHSESFRTVFAADEVLHVLQGTLVLANPETGEVVRAEPGESVFFRRDTWHHGFSYGEDALRVLEFFAPPPATGTSGAYAQTWPYLTESVYADDTLLGRLVERPAPRSFHVLRPEDAVWRLDLGVLVGLLVSTEHVVVVAQWRAVEDPCVPVDHPGSFDGKIRVTREDPGPMLPWLERVGG